MRQDFFDFYNPRLGKTANWRFVADGVMGGLSQGEIGSMSLSGMKCVCLQGKVSLANQGGFVQMKLDLAANPSPNWLDYQGILLEVLGDGQSYNLHLRTYQLERPWQSFRVSFLTASHWQSIYLPFSRFLPHRTTAVFNPAMVRTIGVVAIGQAGPVKICVARLALYNNLE
jgi:hypothetical protein